MSSVRSSPMSDGNQLINWCVVGGCCVFGAEVFEAF